MTATVANNPRKCKADVAALAKSLVVDPSGIASAVAECARVNISSSADLRTRASDILRVAIHSGPSACKTLAVFSRRLHDRYPRFKTDNGNTLTFASVMFSACEAELLSIQTSVQQLGDKMIDENTPIDISTLRQRGCASEDEGCNTGICSMAQSGDHSQIALSNCLRHLDALQIFIACLYTQDIVPEIFVHKILDNYRFSSLSWPKPAQNLGIMSACDMMNFCGKRLEKLGSLCHVMPDWYSYLRSLQQDLSIPQQVRDRIMSVVQLREHHWVSDKAVTV